MIPAALNGIPVRRPLVGWALGAAVGCALAAFSNAPVALFSAAGIGCCAAAWLPVLNPHRSLLLLTALFLSFAARHQAAEQVRHARLAPLHRQTLRAEGLITEQPRILREQQLFMMETTRIFHDGSWKEIPLRMQVCAPEEADLQALRPGGSVRLSGRFHLFERPGRCVGRLYLRPGSEKPDPAPSFRLKAACLQWREAAGATLQNGMHDQAQEAGLIRALLLGFREEVPSELRNAFIRTGTMHIFALSGLHVGILCAIAVFILSRCGISRRFWVLTLAPLLFLFVLGTGLRASTLRAFLMAVLYWTAPLLNRKPDAPSALACAALLLLAADPLQISDPGFLLSFTVVAGILLAWHAAGESMSVPVADSPGLQRLQRLLFGIKATALTTSAAWLFSLPLGALFFGQISLTAVPMNLLVVPLTSVVITGGVVSLFAAGLWPAAGALCNQLNGLVVQGITVMINRTAELAWSALPVSAPALHETGLWYAGVVLGLLHARRKNPRRNGILLCAAALTLYLLRTL